MMRGLKSWQLGIAIRLNQLLKSQRKPARPCWHLMAFADSRKAAGAGLGIRAAAQGSPALPDCGEALPLARANLTRVCDPGGAYLDDHRPAS
jgi:hypothetical protein